MKPMVPASSIALREVVSIEPADEGGWWATYAPCGHRELWKIAPPTGTASCPECLRELGARGPR